MPTEGGSCPLRVCGTRFVFTSGCPVKNSNRFGAYLSHLITIMTEDSRVKSVDQQKICFEVAGFQNTAWLCIFS